MPNHRKPIIIINGIKYKSCSKCGQEKPLTEFYVRKERNSYDSQCSSCKNMLKNERRKSPEAKKKQKEYDALRRQNPEVKERESKRNIEYRNKPENKARIKELRKIRESTLEFREKRKLADKQRNQTSHRKEYEKQRNQDPEIKERKKQARQKPARQQKRRNRENQKRNTDPSFKLHSNISRAFRLYFEHNGLSKNSISTNKYLEKLGYNFETFKKHIESYFHIPGNEWMNWNNQGPYNPQTHDNNPTWNLDHIIPLSDLPINSIEDENFFKAWSLSNLRPLDSKQNILDGVNRTRHIKKFP